MTHDRYWIVPQVLMLLMQEPHTYIQSQGETGMHATRQAWHTGAHIPDMTLPLLPLPLSLLLPVPVPAWCHASNIGTGTRIQNWRRLVGIGVPIDMIPVINALLPEVPVAIQSLNCRSFIEESKLTSSCLGTSTSVRLPSQVFAVRSCCCCCFSFCVLLWGRWFCLVLSRLCLSLCCVGGGCPAPPLWTHPDFFSSFCFGSCLHATPPVLVVVHRSVPTSKRAKCRRQERKEGRGRTC